jgi:hypothetical protein
MATAPADRVAAPTITDARAHPMLAVPLKRLAGFTERLDVCNRRRQEIAAALQTAKKEANPAADAARIRAGVKVDFAGQEVSAVNRDGLEREDKALSREIAALEIAIEQEEVAIDSAKPAALEAVMADIGPYLAKSDRHTAATFRAFSAAREERINLARGLVQKGYSDLGKDIAAGGVLPAMGSATEKDSPMGLILRSLADRGL